MAGSPDLASAYESLGSLLSRFRAARSSDRLVPHCRALRALWDAVVAVLIVYLVEGGSTIDPGETSASGSCLAFARAPSPTHRPSKVVVLVGSDAVSSHGRPSMRA